MAKSLLHVVFWLFAGCAALSAQTAKQSLLAFESTCFDVGSIMDNEPAVSREFRFTNVSGKALVLSSVYTTCNCLQAVYDRKTILPGEQGSLVLTFNPSNYTGDIHVKALVYTSVSGKEVAAKLEVEGNVGISDQWWYLPQKMGELRLKRKTVEVDELGTTGKRQVRVLCANTGKKAMRLGAGSLPSYASFRTEPEAIAPGDEADLIIELDAASLARMENRSEKVEFEFMLEGTGARNPFSCIMNVLILPSINEK